MPNKEDMVIDLIVNGKRAKVELDGVERKTKKVADRTKQTESIITSSWIKIGASIFAAKQALDFTRNIDTVKTRLVVATGSVENAEKKFDEFAETSDRMGLSLISLADSYSSFKIASDLAGASAADTERIFKSITTASAAMNLTADQTRGAFRALEQMMSKGNVQAEELRGQLGERILGAFNLAAKAMGVTTQELNKMLQSGQVLAKDLLPKLADVLENEFAEKAKKSANSINAAYNRVNNVFTTLGSTFAKFLGDSGILWLFTKAVNVLQLSFSGLSGAALAAKMAFKAIFGKQAQEDVEAYNKWIISNQKIIDKFSGKSKVMHMEIKKHVKETAAETKKSTEANKDFFDNLEDGYKAYAGMLLTASEKQKGLSEEMKRNQSEAKEIANVGRNAMGELEDAFVTAAMTGKLSFKDMTKSIIADLVRIQIRQLIVGTMSGFSGGGGLLSGLFHTGTPEVKHTGGLIGAMPSYHTGLRSDERIARLQVGEAVINRTGAQNNKEAINAMNKGQTVGGGGGSTTAEINFNVTAIDANSFNSYLVNNKQTIENIINRSLTTNGSVRQTIKQVV